MLQTNSARPQSLLHQHSGPASSACKSRTGQGKQHQPAICAAAVLDAVLSVLCLSVLFLPQEVLLQQVTQQGDNLHFVALAAAQVGSESDMPELAKTLIQDLEVGCPPDDVSWASLISELCASARRHKRPLGCVSSGGYAR